MRVPRLSTPPPRDGGGPPPAPLATRVLDAVRFHSPLYVAVAVATTAPRVDWLSEVGAVLLTAGGGILFARNMRGAALLRPIGQTLVATLACLLLALGFNAFSPLAAAAPLTLAAVLALRGARKH